MLSTQWPRLNEPLVLQPCCSRVSVRENVRKINEKRILAKIGQYADRIETAVASIAFAFMCLFVLVTIVFRYVLRQPISWTEEASRYLMITGIFVAMPVAVRSHVHLGVDLFINLLPKGGKRFAGFFS